MTPKLDPSTNQIQFNPSPLITYATENVNGSMSERTEFYEYDKQSGNPLEFSNEAKTDWIQIISVQQPYKSVVKRAMEDNNCLISNGTNNTRKSHLNRMPYVFNV